MNLKFDYLNSLVEDMTDDNIVDYEYLKTLTRIPEDQLKNKVLHLRFADFLELQIAIDSMDSDKIIQILDFGHHVEEGMGDNPYSSVRPGGMGGSGMSSSNAVASSSDTELSQAMSGHPNSKKPTTLPTNKKTTGSIKNDRTADLTNYKAGDDVIVSGPDGELEAKVIRQDSKGMIVGKDGKEFLIPVGSADYDVISATNEEADLKRLRELAGIAETSSGGATGAGGIASVSTPIGGTQSREMNRSIYTSRILRKKNKKAK